MRSFGFAAAVALLVVGFTAGAAEARNRQYSLSVSPMVGAHVFEGNQDLDSGALASLGFGYNFDERVGLEGVLSFSDSATDDMAADDVNVYGVRLDALYHFRPGRAFVPYLAAGVGALILDSDDDSDQDGALNYGLGFKYFFTDAFAFRGDVRHLLDWNLRDGDDTPEFYNNLIASAGFTLQFGGQRPPAPAAAKEVPPAVAIPEPVATVQPAEPPKPTPPAPPAPVPVSDADRDGVADAGDKCPNTPWGPVDERGCPKDGDGDGVADVVDQCPDTAPGLKVNVRGCPEARLLRIDVEFASGSAEIAPRYHAELKTAADYIQALPAGRIVIEGHTDSVGPDAANLELSAQRAETVRQYLIDNFGIPAARLEAKGYGETQPVGNNATQEGRKMNRRVVIRSAP